MASDPDFALAPLRTGLASFDALDPFGDGRSFFDVKAVGTAMVFGPKRYAVRDARGDLVSFTEHVIGGFLPPPGTTGRDHDGHHIWAHQTVDVLVKARSAGLSAVVPAFPWEPDAPDFPALIRCCLSGPGALSKVPAELGLRPFASIVEAIAVVRDVHPIAADPGGDLSGWRDLDWHDSRTGPSDLGDHGPGRDREGAHLYLARSGRCLGTTGPGRPADIGAHRPAALPTGG